jgi:hypothetical protein
VTDRPPPSPGPLAGLAKLLLVLAARRRRERQATPEPASADCGHRGPAGHPQSVANFASGRRPRRRTAGRGQAAPRKKEAAG